MANFNKVILMGNLTRDPEVRTTPGGLSIAKLGLAVNRVYTTKEGEKREETTFVDCDAFGKQAETLGKYLSKGSSLLLEGRLKLDTWEDKEGGKRSKLTVVIESFQFVGSKPAGEGGASVPAGQSTPPPDRDIDEDVPF